MLAVKTNGPDGDPCYVFTVAFTLEIWHLEKVVAHHWIIGKICFKY